MSIDMPDMSFEVPGAGNPSLATLFPGFAHAWKLPSPMSFVMSDVTWRAGTGRKALPAVRFGDVVSLPLSPHASLHAHACGGSDSKDTRAVLSLT